jgi:disulfide bond formation protein DsbB
MNMNTNSPTVAIAATVILFIGIFLGIYGSYVQPAFGSDATQIPATHASTTRITVTTTASTAFATSTCAARTITTSASPVMLTFSDITGQTPTGSLGHLQAASTTVTYDAGLYGCGRLKVYSDATQLITVSEFR